MLSLQGRDIHHVHPLAVSMRLQQVVDSALKLTDVGRRLPDRGADTAPKQPPPTPITLEQPDGTIGADDPDVTDLCWSPHRIDVATSQAIADAGAACLAETTATEYEVCPPCICL